MRYRSFTVLFVLGVLSVTALAVTPQFWENFSQDELLQGTLTRVSLSPEGRLFLAPSYEAVYDTNQPYIFSMVRDKAGNTYLGTGHEGKVYRIDAQGKGTVYYQPKELDIFALALDASDALYVGTSPDGKVYKVTGPNQATEFCNPEEKYIWSLMFDDAGNLYVGTGTRGIIFKVDRGGKKSTFFDSPDTHVVCMARESNGNLLAGTSPGGLVIEVTPEGKAFTLLDTPMEEVRSLAVDRFGTIYAVASASKGLPQRGKAEIITTTTTAGTLPVMTIQSLASLAEKSAESKAAVSAPGSEKDSAGNRSAIYAISKDGNAETVYASKDQMVFDIVVRNDGSLLAATGPKGRLLSIDVAKQVTVVTDSPEEEITRLAASGDAVWAAGSNQGKVYRLDSQRAQTGTFESKVLDAKTVASWGRIAWRTSGPAGGSTELSTRTGNTEKPDNSWSNWSASYASAGGQQITNPRARYLQWRAVFKRAGSAAASQQADTLENVQIPYLQQNMRPQVVNISVLPNGVALQKTPSLQPGMLSAGVSPTASDGMSLNSPRERGKEKQALPPRQVLQPGAQSFTWKASDDNDDDLQYSLYFKGEGESDWKPLEKDLTDTFYTLDGASLPDGIYRLKVVASDEPSNPYGKFLIGELVSRPFVISNTTPLVEITGHKLNGRRVELTFRAKVPVGRIASAEFSIDGGEWYLVFPVDGLADSAQEDFQVATPELSVGEHLIGLRSSDGNGNTGTTKLVVKVP